MKTQIQSVTLLLITVLFCSLTTNSYAQAEYNQCAGQNVIYDDYKLYSKDSKIRAAARKKAKVKLAKGAKGKPSANVYIAPTATKEDASALQDANRAYRIELQEQEDGTTKEVRVERKKVSVDKYGNASSNDFDLAVDGAFEGKTIAVLHFYTGENFDFELPKKALAEKGFSVFRWLNYPPSPEELREKLKKANQLWIISHMDQRLNEKHLEVIKEFFESGKGVYIWGDNSPYYADANFVGSALLDITMKGNLPGHKTVQLKEKHNKSGILQNHLITTGMNFIYEGITIATIQDNEHMTPLIWGSAGNLVTAVYEQDGRRAIFDGGFTRLFLSWDEAGTGRYVKNAASWLANVENQKKGS
jgi:hypothetical protein